MKVKELIELLEKRNPNAEVIMSKDSEGNDFSPFSDASENSLYKAETTWMGEIYDKESYDEDEWEEILEEDVVEAVVLYPIN